MAKPGKYKITNLSIVEPIPADIHDMHSKLTYEQQIKIRKEVITQIQAQASAIIPRLVANRVIEQTRRNIDKERTRLARVEAHNNVTTSYLEVEAEGG